MRRWELDEIDAGRYDTPPIWGLGQDGPTSEPAIPLTERDVEALGIEVVVGGVHWARGIAPEPRAIIDNFHAQNMYLATHPLVDIVAHPWWWHDHFTYPDGTYVQAPWTADFGAIPESHHDEFAAALVRHGTAAEINPQWVLGKPYGERFYRQYIAYLAYLKARGVVFSTASDCHGRPYAPQ